MGFEHLSPDRAIAGMKPSRPTMALRLFAALSYSKGVFPVAEAHPTPATPRVLMRKSE